MTEEQGIELNRILCAWVRGNHRLSRQTVYWRQLIEFNGDIIVVELKRFNDSYLERHVIGKVGNYANSFLVALEPILIKYLLKIGVEKMEFTVLFKFDFELRKYIEVSIV